MSDLAVPVQNTLYSLTWKQILFILIVPIFFAVLINTIFVRNLALIGSDNSTYGVGQLYWIMMLIDTMHVMATFFFLRQNKHIQKNLGKLLWVLPLVIFSTSYLILFFSWQILLQSVAYIVLFHTVLQQFGWFQRSFDKLVDNRTYTIYKSIFVACSLIPILYWHTGANDYGSWYFFNNVIVSFLPRELGSYIANFGLLVILIGTLVLAVSRKIFVKPFALLGITWFIYFYGLIYSGSLLHFVVCLVASHAGGYVIFTLGHLYKSEGHTILKANMIGHNIYKILLLTAISAFWIYCLKYLLTSSIYFVPISLAPTTLHLAFDSLIWRKRFKANA